MSTKCGIVIISFWCAIFSVTEGCTTKVYPDEKLAIDPTFLCLFNALSRSDTLWFKNSRGIHKAFIIQKVDSIINNKKGWFINSSPYKMIRCELKELGNDTTALQRPNIIFVNKDPVRDENTISIEFNNFYYTIEDSLPSPKRDSLFSFHNSVQTYYSFKSKIRGKNRNDVEDVFLTMEIGLIAFKTFSGEVWVRIDV